MIDPNIALSYRPTEMGIETPTQVMTGTQQLSNLQNAGQLQQAELTGANQQNAAQALQMKTLAATNQAIAASTKIGPDGSPVIDHAAVIKTLAQNGMGIAAQQYQDAQTKRDEELTKLSGEQLSQYKQQHDFVNSSLGSVLAISDPVARQAEWTKRSQEFYAKKLAAPGSIQAQVPDEPTLKTMLYGSMDASQQINALLAQQNADSNEKRADAAQKKADAYMEKVIGDNTPRPEFTKQYDIHNHPMMQGADGKLYVDTSITGAPYTDSGSGRGNGETANSRAVDQRQAQKQYDDVTAEESDLNTLRSRLGQALKSRSMYVDQAGKLQSASKLTDNEKDEAFSDMQERFDGATRRLNQILPQKYELGAKLGKGAPSVSLQQSLDAINGKASAPANTSQSSQSSQSSQPGKVLTSDPTGKSQFKVGQTVRVNKTGKTIKIAGFTPDGKVIPAQ